MTHQAKAPSGSTQATGSSRGLLCRALATRSTRIHSKGSGAPSSYRAPLALIGVLAGIASLACAAAPASAAPLAAKMETISNVSYASAHVTGKLTSPCDGLCGTSYTFQYATSESGPWNSGPSGFISGLFNPAFEDKPIEGEFEQAHGLKGGTEYFVRLTASTAGEPDVFDPSAPPYPSFTTLAVDPPSIPGTVDASPIFSTSAKVSAEVERPANENAAFDVKCHFEYITDAQYEENVNVNSLPGFDGATSIDCDPNPITSEKVDVENKAEVSALLTGLSPDTAYRLRLLVENAAPGVVAKEAASTFTTLPPVAKPAVISANDATDVSYLSAKVSGEVQRPEGDDPALDTSCRFEYVTDANFTATGFDNAGRADCVEAPAWAPLTSTDPTLVTAELSGLNDETTYHLRLTAENGGGTTSKDATNTFTTLTAIDPVLELNPISPADVGYSKVHLTGTIDPGTPERAITYGWELSTDPDDWSGALGSLCCSGQQGKQEYSKDFAELNPGTKYYARLIAIDVTGGQQPFPSIEEPGPYESFTTLGTTTPPSANCDPITIFTANTAHFSCTVDTNAPAGPLSDDGKAVYRTDWHFECTPECKDVNGNVIGGTVEAEEGSKTISADAKRLDPNMDYEVKLVVHNVLGTVETPVHTFKTPLIEPTVKAAPGGSDGKGGYTLQGVVNPNNSPVTDCKFEWGPNSADYAFTADCSPPPGDKAQPVTVEAHLTGLNPGVVYHFNLFATNGAGTAESGDQEFIPTLSPPDNCANEQLRIENSSLALPECRAYEKVTPSGKEGFGAFFKAYSGGDRVSYVSGAGNIAKSGQNALKNSYVAARTVAGWETIPNLNGSSGTLRDAPSYVTNPSAVPVAYSSDLLSSLWQINRIGGPPGINDYLRSPDGTFTFIGPPHGAAAAAALSSADLSHVVRWTLPGGGALVWGPGVYEFVGTGNDEPRRVDVDNSKTPITACRYSSQDGQGYNAGGEFNSGDGRVVVFRVAGGCGGANPPAQEIWARIDGTTSVDVSASQCNRTAPAEPCNGPANSIFQGAAEDGSRVFFTTTQQLLDADTDQTNDIYACDIPGGTPPPTAEKANHCAALVQVSRGAPVGATVESLAANSADGSAAYFVAKGALADNEDVLGEKALAGDHNLYAWRTDPAHPAGQTTFVGRLDSNDLSIWPQATPDGRYLVFTTASQLVETDTDSARDVYRYDVEIRQLTRASTNVFGVAGNGPSFDTDIPAAGAVSDSGQRIVFTTSEPLSPNDGNGETDLYLWTPERVLLITTGSVGGGTSDADGVQATISGSGQDIYFQTADALTPADGDDIVDIYDARIGGGFSFSSPERCSDELCRPSPSPVPVVQPSPANRPNGEGNVKSKTCRKGKVLRGTKCVKRSKPKKHKKPHGKSGHKRGGSK